ncbi:MAG: hypothetical protein HEQ25_10450 [Dolichospermum sp. DET73]|nr:hypothetical protein [Dolichospermum sp. DET73]
MKESEVRSQKREGVRSQESGVRRGKESEGESRKRKEKAERGRNFLLLLSFFLSFFFISPDS